jgi:hypothetical protein
MTISEILSANLIHRLDHPSLGEGEILALERKLKFKFPEEFVEFLILGGFNDLRFRQELLQPNRIVDSYRDSNSRIVPFASDGCGSLFGWLPGQRPSDTVYRWDHETDEVTRFAGSFLDCLRLWRF